MPVFGLWVGQLTDEFPTLIGQNTLNFSIFRAKRKLSDQSGWTASIGSFGGEEIHALAKMFLDRSDYGFAP